MTDPTEAYPPGYPAPGTPGTAVQAVRTVPVDEDIRDFSIPLKKNKFRINDDVFEGPALLPAQVLFDFAAQFENVTDASPMAEQMRAMTGALRLVLYPASAELFINRMGDIEKPITASQVEEIIDWLMEKHGLRPTLRPVNSSDGSNSQEPGTSSTANVPDGVLIPADSP